MLRWRYMLYARRYIIQLRLREPLRYIDAARWRYYTRDMLLR